MNDATKRILVSIAGIPLILAAIWFGRLYFAIMVALIALLGLSELYRMAQLKQVYPNLWIGGIATVSVAWALYGGRSDVILIILIAATLLTLMFEMFVTAETPMHNTAVTLFGILYVGLCLSSLIGIRESRIFSDYSAVGALVIVVFVGVWICDTAAYFLGVKFGKHRLFEQVSPKKSIEGSVSGLLGTALVLFGMFYSGLLPEMSLLMTVVLILIIGVFGQIGDLMESWLKRTVGVKDSSALIPGHGGVLDRFDSILMVAPLVFLSIQLNIF